MSTPDIVEELVYCTVHPDREATLRCNKCGRPMCVQCAVQTPVGYRCRECVRGIQSTYYNANPYDDVIAFGVAAVATAVIAYLVSTLRVPLFFLLILGFPAGGAVSELIVRVTQKRRSRNMSYFAAAGAVIGGLGAAVFRQIVLHGELVAVARARGIQGDFPLDISTIFSGLLSNFGVLLIVGIVAVAVYTRLRMRG